MNIPNNRLATVTHMHMFDLDGLLASIAVLPQYADLLAVNFEHPFHTPPLAQAAPCSGPRNGLCACHEPTGLPSFNFRRGRDDAAF